MTPERARQLLGGLATGILTPEERQTLFAAALDDQTLFNEVADELEFAAFLQSPETRAQLANRIEVPAGVEPEPRRRWWVLRPALRPQWMALSGALAAITVLYVAIGHRPQLPAPERPPQEMVRREPAPVQATIPAVAQPEAAAPATPAPAPPSAETRAEVPADTTAKTKDEPIIAERSAQPKNLRAQGPIAQAPASAPVPQQFAPSTETPAKPKAATIMGGMGGGGSRSADAMVPLAAPAPKTPGTAATASLEGMVRDQAGAAVANAQIEIVNTATRTINHTTSDPSGHFTATSLAEGGPYLVTAQAPGFQPQIRSGIMLGSNQPGRVDIQLPVGAATQVVAITASAATLSADLAPRQQVAVLDFVNRTSESQSGQHAADLISAQLVNSGQVRVIDRQKVQQSLSKSASGKKTSPQDAAALGRALGADAVILGTVQPKDKSQSTVALTAQVIDTKKGRPSATVAASGPSIEGATSELSIALTSQLLAPVEGSITAWDAQSATVTFQPPAQPRIGERFFVYRGRRKIGELTLTSAFGQSAAGKFSGSGQPRVGDRVTSVR